jgi:hypothetical protein
LNGLFHFLKSPGPNTPSQTAVRYSFDERRAPDAAPFPDRKQDLYHLGLNAYMEQHKVRDILFEMIPYLVEQRSEDHIQGALDFLDQHQRS